MSAANTKGDPAVGSTVEPSKPQPGSGSAPERGPQRQLARFSDTLATALVAAGVREVVASPGSRSTPFLLAIARCRSLRLHMVVDERSAAFFALGQARLSGRPSALLCTSGTALSHFSPAVVEASCAGLPLLVLSADRPAELQRCGAPQTIDQAGFFGGHVRASFQLPASGSAVLAAAARMVRQAVAQSRGPDPGPVHLNLPVPKPLEPDWSAEPAPPEARRVYPAMATPDGHALDEVAAQLQRAHRPLLVAGPTPLYQSIAPPAFALGRRGLPLAAEAGSQLRFAGASREGCAVADAYDRYLAHYRPDVILEVGGTPTSAGYAAYLADRPPLFRAVLSPVFRDASNRADVVVCGDVGRALEGLLARVESVSDEPFAPDARACVDGLEGTVWSVIHRQLGDGGAQPLSEAAALRCVFSELPPGALLGLGNSLPIRHANRYVLGSDHDLRVWVQRGANGIDGWIAQAAAIAIAAERPSAVVLGDVAAMHDIGSLGLAARATAPLLLVVLDNGGGRIFEQLPVRQQIDDVAFERLFATPPALDWAAVARAFGVGYGRAETEPELRNALRQALGAKAATLVHVAVPPSGAARLEAELSRALAAALGGDAK